MKVRCIDAGNSAFLKVGNVYSVLAERFGLWDLISDDGWMFISFAPRLFEPVTDETEAPTEQPKVDKYEAHRLKWDESGSAAMQMLDQDAISGATARLLRGLEGEKVRERVRAFPKQGRNFELKGKR